MFLWNEALESGKLVKPETLQLVFTPSRLNDGREAVFGLGWMIGRYKGLREIHHGGDITGFSTEVCRFPDQKLIVIVLSNIGMRPPGPLPNALDLSRKIAEIYLGDQMKEEPEVKVTRLDTAVLDLYVGEYEIEAPEVVLREGGRTFSNHARRRSFDGREQNGQDGTSGGIGNRFPGQRLSGEADFHEGSGRESEPGSFQRHGCQGVPGAPDQ